MPDVDAGSLMVFDYLHRNWAVVELSDAASLAVTRLNAPNRSADDALLDRLVDPAARLPTVAEIEASGLPTTRVLAAALHCDRRPLSAAQDEALASLTDGGGYNTTHAALAVQWMAELGCSADGSLRSEIVDKIAAELTSATAVTDLALEQSSVLWYLGAIDEVPDDWRARVIAAQRADGSWVDGENTWHTTLLAVWTLLALDSPGKGVPMVRAAGALLPTAGSSLPTAESSLPTAVPR